MKQKKEKAAELQIRLKDIRLILIGIVVILVIGVVIGIRFRAKTSVGEELGAAVGDLLHSEEGKVTTVTRSSIEKVVHDSKLYTAEYPYNGIAAVYDTDTGALKYHVAYEGTVKAGINVSKIWVSLDEDTHTIAIYLPQVQVEEAVVNAGTLEYIFEDPKYNTETVAQEAYKAAIAHLQRRVKDDSKIIEIATDNAKLVERALVEPWVNQVSDDTQYTVRVIGYGEE